MCGIIGYSGKEKARDVILNGLYALEYRGYDSAGMSLLGKNGIHTVKTEGRITKLEEKTKSGTDNMTCGIGHTRWATHGKPSTVNAHPHGTENLMLVHNGIIENCDEIKQFLRQKGYDFQSETDTEAAAKLLDFIYSTEQDEITALQKTAARLRGSFALGVIFANTPNTVYATKQDSPLLIGIGEKGNFIASDISAFSEYTLTYIRLEDGETAKITDAAITVFDANGKVAEKKAENAEKQNGSALKDGYAHYMLQEIFEEPTIMKDTYLSIAKDNLPDFSESNIDDTFFANIGTIHIIACGTAMHAGLLGKYYIEKLARIKVSVEIASEFRYSEPILKNNDAVIIISQSGETADSLAALRLVKKKKIRTVAIVNTPDSSIAREADKVISTKAGREIAVASTKAFHAQTEVLFILALKLAVTEGKLPKTEAFKKCTDLKKSFSQSIGSVLSDISPIKKCAKIAAEHSSIFFIGRGSDSYLSMEASLKMKEITYIHSEAYAAGELKHGTISLIENGTIVIAIAANTKHHEKLRNNIEEVKGRGAFVAAIAPNDADLIKAAADFFIPLPDSDELMTPFTAATTVQLLAYYTALELGRDIDKPRNLAKSVTVE